MRLTPAPEARRARGSYSVPGFCLALNLGSHYAPGYFSNALWIDGASSSLHRTACVCFSVSILDQANNSRRLVNVDDESDVSSFTTHIQLCSAEFLVEFKVTAFHSRFTD